MNDLHRKTVYELADRLNQIERTIHDLGVEYNEIVHELHKRLPNLKDDVNIQPKTLTRTKEKR